MLAAAVQEGAEALVISDLPYNFANRRLIVQLAAAVGLFLSDAAWGVIP